MVLQIAPRLLLSGPQPGVMATPGDDPENRQERAKKGQGSGLRSIGWGWRVLEFERAIRRLELHVEQFRTPGDIRPEIDAGCTRGQPGQSQRESVAIGGDPGTEWACSTAATASASRTGRRADIHLHEAGESALQDRRGVDSGSRRDRGCIRQCIEPDGRQPSALPIRGAQRALRCGVLDRHVHRERRPPLEKAKFPKVPKALSIEGGRFTAVWLHPPPPLQDQFTSNVGSPALTTMADAGPLIAKPVTSGSPINNLRITRSPFAS